MTGYKLRSHSTISRTMTRLAGNKSPRIPRPLLFLETIARAFPSQRGTTLARSGSRAARTYGEQYTIIYPYLRGYGFTLRKTRAARRTPLLPHQGFLLKGTARASVAPIDYVRARFFSHVPRSAHATTGSSTPVLNYRDSACDRSFIRLGSICPQLDIDRGPS